MSNTNPAASARSPRRSRLWMHSINVAFALAVIAVLTASTAEADGKPKAKPAASAKPSAKPLGSAKPSGSASSSASSAASARGPGARTPGSGSCDNASSSCSGAGEICRDNLCYCIGPTNARCKKPTSTFKDCTSLTDNADHCGACGHACPARAECTDGKCVACQPGFSVCPGQESDPHGLRSCADLKNDSSNCGKCDHSCPESWTCLNGHCEP